MERTLFLTHHQKPGPKPQGMTKTDRIILLVVSMLVLGASLYFKLQNPSREDSSFSLAQKEIVWQSTRR